ncbi:RNA polymerase, partial [Streptomyces nigrescens]
MRERRPAQERHHAREFEGFAAGRMLHTATLLTGGSPPGPPRPPGVGHPPQARTALGRLLAPLANSSVALARAVTARPWLPPRRPTPPLARRGGERQVRRPVPS